MNEEEFVNFTKLMQSGDVGKMSASEVLNKDFVDVEGTTENSFYRLARSNINIYEGRMLSKNDVAAMRSNVIESYERIKTRAKLYFASHTI